MNKFENHENKRSKSVVAAIISNPPEQTVRNETSVILKEKSETRSRKLNLLVTPSLYEKAQKKCSEIGISFNECVNQLLNNWVDME